jgi:hypothetical protein
MPLSMQICVVVLNLLLQAPANLVLTEGVYTKMGSDRLCKVTSEADRTVLHTLQNGTWCPVKPAFKVPKEKGEGEVKGKGKSKSKVPPVIVVPKGCTVIVPVVEVVKGLFTDALYQELVDFAREGSAVFDSSRLSTFIQGERL